MARTPKADASANGARGGIESADGPSLRTYLTDDATVLNVPLRLVPTAVTAVMMTTAISAAIRPYSMAVAPDSSRKNIARRFMTHSRCKWRREPVSGHALDRLREVLRRSR